MKTIYVKITDACSLRCKHCYIGSPNNTHLNIEAFISWLEQFLIINKEKIELVFHGGEPGVYPSRILKILNAFQNNSNIIFNITTNLVYKITNEHKSIFKTCNIATSYDAGHIRFTNSNELELWKANCKLVSSNKSNMQLNVVLTTELLQNKPEQLYNICTEIGIYNIHFERLAIIGNALDLSIPTWDEVDEWLCTVYDTKPTDIKVIEFEELSLLYNFNKKFGCKLRQCTQDVLTINPDGTIATCPNQFDFIISNIWEPIANLYNSSEFTCISCKEKRKNIQCYACDYYLYCNGECFQLQWQENACPFPKKLFEKIKNEKLSHIL